MAKIVIIKVGEEITGVYVSKSDLVIEIIDFSKTLPPWHENTLDQIDQSKLVKIAP